MSADNKTLGRFELLGIPPAQRGIPQIDVAFDIDANGILHVSAKDLGTGKEQKIKITASSGLDEEQIKKMVSEAEAYSKEDKEKRKLVDAKNMADALVYSSEKSIEENKDKFSEEETKEMKAAIEQAKQALSGDDEAKITATTEELTKVMQKHSAKLYPQQPENDAAKASGSDPQGDPAAKAKADDKSNDDKIIDADYEEVKN